MVEISYIVRSGIGYFVRFSEVGSQEMTSDPVVATRMNKLVAKGIVQRMVAVGFNAELVEVKLGKI